jgi:hypothetical protein
MWRLRYIERSRSWPTPQHSLRDVSSHTFRWHGSEGLGCLGGCGPCRSNLALGYDTRFLTTQDAHVRGDSNDEVPMVPTLYGRLATAMTIAVSRRHCTLDGDDGDNEPMWSLKLASSWARLDAACGSQALAESEPLITTALLKLKLFTTCTVCAGFSPKAGCVGCCLWALPNMPYKELTSQG